MWSYLLLTQIDKQKSLFISSIKMESLNTWGESRHFNLFETIHIFKSIIKWTLGEDAYRLIASLAKVTAECQDNAEWKCTCQKCSDLMGITLSKKMCSPRAPLDSEAQRINTEGAVLRVFMHSWYTLSKRLPVYAHIPYTSSVLSWRALNTRRES